MYFKNEALKNLSGTCINPSLDNANYSFGWSQFNSTYTPPNGYQSIYEAFQHKTAESLQGSPIEGIYDTYDGSGYLYEMRGKLSYIQGNLSLLKEMNWVDRQTRAVLVEFSAYNPNINLVMVSTTLVEFLSSGTLLTKAKFDPLNLFSESGGIASFKTISELIFVACMVYFVIVEIIKLSNMNFKEYMSDFMTYIDCSIIITACISCYMILVRVRAAQEVLDFFKQTAGYGYIKLQTVNDCNQTLTYSLGLCAALGTIKFLKMLRFNRNIAFLGKTLNYCLHELISCTLIFFVIWIAFVQVMYFIYNNDLREYSSPTKSMESAFLIILGKFDAKKFLFTNTVFGPCVFAAYNVFVLWFALNIFVSIITGSFDKVRHEAKENPEDDFVYMYKYLVEKWRNYFKQKPLYSSFFKRQNKVSGVSNTESLSDFTAQIDRLIDILTTVIFFQFFFTFNPFITENLTNQITKFLMHF